MVITLHQRKGRMLSKHQGPPIGKVKTTSRNGPSVLRAAAAAAAAAATRAATTSYDNKKLECAPEQLREPPPADIVTAAVAAVSARSVQHKPTGSGPTVFQSVHRQGVGDYAERASSRSRRGISPAGGRSVAAGRRLHAGAGRRRAA
jgi:hypothetical protein